MQQEKTYTVREYAELEGVERTTVYRRIKTHQLETRKEDGKLLVVTREYVPDVDLSQVVEILREQVQQKDAQITALLEQIADLQRSVEQKNFIILRMTYNSEEAQKMLEHRRKPFFRRWFGRRQDDIDATIEGAPVFEGAPYEGSTDPDAV